eukprot:1158981-Pelagomonas_calceolata.AAC.12
MPQSIERDKKRKEKLQRQQSHSLHQGQEGRASNTLLSFLGGFQEGCFQNDQVNVRRMGSSGVGCP